MKPTPIRCVKLLAFILLMLPLQNFAFFQDPLIIPDAKDIFAANVDVLDTKIEFRPYFDNTARTVWTFLPEQKVWVSFLYPDEFATIANIQLQEDGIVVLSVAEKTETDQTKRQIWSLNPTTNQFSRYENKCVEPSDFPVLRVEAHWALYTDPKINQTALCFTGTGQSEYSLSQDMHWDSVNETENPEWLTLFAWPVQLSYSHTWDLYSYHILTHKLIHLGTIPVENDFYFSKWLSTTEGFWYSGGMPEGAGKGYFYFDVSVPESLSKVIDGRAKFYDNPPRYDYLQTFYEVIHRADPPSPPPCEMNTFDLRSKLTKTFELGQDCFGRVWRVGDQYYYASYTPNTSAGLSLFRFDTIHETKTALLAVDNLAALESISPDGQYVFLLLDDGTHPQLKPLKGEGPLQTYPPVDELDPFYYEDYSLPSSMLGLYDLKGQKWIYRTTAAPIIHETDGERGDIYWIDDNHFYVQTGAEAVVYTISESGVQELSRYRGRIESAPDNRHGIIWDDAAKSLEVVDLVNDSHSLIAKFPSNLASCFLSRDWVNKNELKLSACIRDDESNDKTLTMTYHIRIPD